MAKKEFIVYVREMWIQPTRIFAESEEASRELVQDGEGDQIEEWLEYAEPIQSNDDNPWRVEEIKPKE
jgi:hypothetical protein